MLLYEIENHEEEEAVERIYEYINKQKKPTVVEMYESNDNLNESWSYDFHRVEITGEIHVFFTSGTYLDEMEHLMCQKDENMILYTTHPLEPFRECENMLVLITDKEGNVKKKYYLEGEFFDLFQFDRKQHLNARIHIEEKYKVDGTDGNVLIVGHN